MSNILNSFVDVAPFINSLTNADFSVSVCDLDRCLLYVASEKLDHGIKSGDPHVKNSVSYESISSGKRIVKRVGSEVFGFPYIAIAIPIREDGEIVGSVTFAEAVDKQDILLALADNLHDTMQQMLSITDTISENSNRLKNVGNSLDDISSQSVKKVEETEYILKFIKSVSDKTNILGLNAFIEAERAGSAGLGFRVVAGEIRNLADSTGEYVKNADSVMKELKSSTDGIKEELEILLSISSDQININNYISNLVKDISERTEKLKENARILSE